MPLHEGGRYLECALRSVLAQRDPGIEVVAVEEGSRDRTREILRAWADRLPMKVLTAPGPCNWAVKTNMAFRAAGGKYISLLHHDDCWMPGRAAALRHRIEAWPEAELIFHSTWFIGAGGERLGMFRPPLEVEGRVDAERLASRLLVQDFVSVPSMAIRGRVFEELGGLDEDLWYSTDWDLLLGLSARGKACYLNRPLACYRVHPLSLTSLEAGKTDEYRRQQETVLRRHAPVLQGKWPRLRQVMPVARFSVDLNVAFSAFANGRPMSLMSIAARFLRLGPFGGWRFWRDSRILSRVMARLRAGVWGRRRGKA